MTSEEKLVEIVEEALVSKELFVINVEVDRDDVSQGLSRFTQALSQKI